MRYSYILVAGLVFFTGVINAQSSELSKISPSLLSLLSKINHSTEIRVEIATTDTIQFASLIRGSAHSITPFHPLHNDRFALEIRANKDQILNWSAYLFVSAIELAREPFTELRQNGLDLTLNHVTFLHHQYPELSGTDLNICIKENLFDTTDIDFKGRVHSIHSASAQTVVHATNMASIAAGGGNSGKSSKGVAWNAFISSSDFIHLLPDPDTHFINSGISVQNHAYGTGIENYYGIESEAYDANTNRLPYLVHVFSAGNAGDQSPTDGTYAGLTGWANLTGQFKQSKNTISVGATDSLDHVVPLSSSGPAYDGRIKPEIVAYGQGGSSGAAAIVSGICLLLQESYLKSFGELPPSSLVRAALINSSGDIESEGPDFKSGYGSVRAYAAVQSIVENRFVISSIDQNEFKTIGITIPPGIRQAKFTLAWIDPAAITQSPKSLVNDLDIRIEEASSGTRFYPWILNTFPHEDSLLQFAERGIDSLNNIELITLDDPAPGAYFMQIRSQSMLTNTQEFSIVWQFDKENEFQWVFPTKDDYLNSDNINTIRWNSTQTENGMIEYRIIGGNWNVVQNNVNPSSGNLKWNSPGIDGLAQLRWFNGTAEVGSDTFVITQPLDPKVVLVCSDSVLINWVHPGTPDSFEILKPGQKHLEIYDSTKDKFFVDRHPDPDNPYYAVRAVYDNIRGPLSYSFDYTQQGAGCYLEVFYLRHVLNGNAFFAAQLSLTDDLDFVVLQEKINGEFVNIQTINQIDSTLLLLESGALNPGINEFRLKIVLETGEELFSQVIIVMYAGESDLLVFPNPASSDQDIIVLTKSFDDFELRIFDVQGRLIFEESGLSSPILIPSLNLYPGIYIIHLNSAEGVSNSRVIWIF